MGKELIFLCWEEGLKKEVESIIEFFCLRPVCFDEVEKFYNQIEKTESFVAIIDVFLPKENGYLVCKKTKEKFENSKIYLTVSKGLSKDELMERWKADGIIYKPLDWKEIEECLLKEGIDFKPPPEEAKTDFEGFIKVLFDLFHTMRNAEVGINDEKIKVSYGWIEKGDFEKIKLQMESEEIYCSFSPLKEPISEESIVHLSEVIRELTKMKKGQSFISLEDTIPTIHPLKKEGLWFLTPYELRLIKRIERGSLRIVDEEKKRLEDALYFLFLSGVISVEEKETKPEFEGEKISEELEEEKPAEGYEISEEKPSFFQEELKMETPITREYAKEETPLLTEAPPQEQQEEGLKLSPPDEGEEEKKVIDEEKAPVFFSPPEELEAIKKYPEEKERLMSYYENLREDEHLLEEVLPPVRPEFEKEEEVSQEPPEQMEEKEESVEELSQREEEVPESPAEQLEKEKQEIPFTSPVSKRIESLTIKKEEKRKKLLLKILPFPFILAGLLYFLIFKRENIYEKSLKQAEELITFTDKENFLKGYENIKWEHVKIALHAAGYEAGWFNSIPAPPECKKNEDFCLLVNNYITTLHGNPPSSIKEEFAQSLLSKYLYGRILLSLEKNRGFLTLEETNLPIAHYILIKEACEMVSFKTLEGIIEKFPDEWKRRAIECAWSRKNYDFILKTFNSIKDKNHEIMKLAGLSYLEKGDESGIRILEEIGSAEAYYRIGNFMEKTGRREEAIKYYSMVKEGEFLESAKKRIQALQEKTLEKPAPPKIEKQKPDLKTLIGMAISERRRANTQEAIRLLKEALKIDPQNPDANYHLGMLLLEMGDFEPAKKHLNTFLTSTPAEDGRRKEVSTLLETIP